MRQSVAPPSRQREEIIYERAPVRTVSARVPVEAYEEDGVLYRRSSPSLAPRRVITQPEYAVPEYRSYRQREYSVRPSAIPGEEYIQIRAPLERRPMGQYEEGTREYLPRAASVRPGPEPIRYEGPRDLTRAPSVRPESIRYEPEGIRYEVPRADLSRAASVRPEPVRYELPREYVPRLSSVRPEGPPREYATSGRAEVRREIISQSEMSRVQPIPESDRYYEDRRPAEVTYIERPREREASVFIYGDDSRREVYR